MPKQERKFTREEPENRRAELIDAALRLLEDGPAAATVRAIADAAGLSPGMIRHHFSSKEDLMNAAYQTHMAAQMERIEREIAGTTARERLVRFLLASLTPPVADARTVSLWAAFIHGVRRDPAMRATHQDSYLAYRDRLEALIAAALDEAGRMTPEVCTRSLAIAGNALIDGLWLEAGALPSAFAPGEIETLGCRSVGVLIGLDLDASDITNGKQS